MTSADLSVSFIYVQESVAKVKLKEQFEGFLAPTTVLVGDGAHFKTPLN